MRRGRRDAEAIRRCSAILVPAADRRQHKEQHERVRRRRTVANPIMCQDADYAATSCR